MFSPRYSRQQGGGLSTLVAVGCAIIAAPAIWPLFDGIVWNSLNEFYSRDISVLLYQGAKWGMYPLCFYVLRTGIAAVFMSLSLFVAKRLM